MDAGSALVPDRFLSWENEQLRRLAGELVGCDTVAAAADAVAGALTALVPAVEAGLYVPGGSGAAAALVRVGHSGRTGDNYRAEDWASLPLALRVPVTDAFRERRTVVLEEAGDWRDYSPELRETVGANGWPSVMVLPLETNARLVGALHVNFPGGEPAGEPARAFVGAVASMASSTLDRLQLFDHAQRAREEADALLRGLQAGLVPAPDPALPVHTVYRPGDQRMLIGGDFFDVLALESGRLSAILGDVAGHGPAAAGVGAQLRTAWRTLVLRGTPDDEILPALDSLLRSTGSGEELFATMLCLCLEPHRGRCVLAVAGHPAPLLLPSGGGARKTAPVVGPPVGLGLADGWATSELQLSAGDQLLLFTDGLFEGLAAPGSSERLGIDGLLALLDGCGPFDGPGLSRLVDRVEEAHGGPLPDDVALLALQGRARRLREDHDQDDDQQDRSDADVHVSPPGSGSLATSLLFPEARSR